MPDHNFTHRFIAYIRTHRFAFLLFSLVLLFLYGAVVDLIKGPYHDVGMRIAIGVFLGYLMVSSALAVSGNRRPSKYMVAFAFVVVVTETLDMWLLRDETQVVSHTLTIVFLSYVIVRILIYIFSMRHVSSDTIFASMCVYLMIGSMWAYVYSLLELFDPNAFSYSLALDTADHVMRIGAEPAGIEFYFSLVTMTTLGYGDVVPASATARSLVTLQAVIGQLFLTVLVARLVGLHVAESIARRK